MVTLATGRLATYEEVHLFSRAFSERIHGTGDDMKQCLPKALILSAVLPVINEKGVAVSSLYIALVLGRSSTSQVSRRVLVAIAENIFATSEDTIGSARSSLSNGLFHKSPGRGPRVS